MKKLMVFYACISMVFFAKAQNTVADKNVGSGPIIEFVKTIHDYGTVKKESDGSCQFVFKNTGNEPLLLTNVTSSCGCTVPTWPKEPVLPGNNGTIKVVYDTKKIGTISKTISVMSNAVNNKVELAIKGNVIE
jgi:hypothetical protein